MLLLWLALTNSVRRLHDFGASGWLALILFIPLVSFGLALYLLFKAGDPWRNAYGEPAGMGDFLERRTEERYNEELAKLAESQGEPVDYLNPDGSFNMDGLFEEQARFHNR